MNIRQRHEELLQKVRTGEPMTKAEMREAESLGTILTDVDRQVAQNPEVIRQRKELAEQAARVQKDLVWTNIFRTNVAGLGNPDDTVGNRQIIWGWLDEARGDVFSADWFAKVISEQPRLAQQLSWTIPLSVKERKAQAEKETHALQNLASEKIHQFNLADNEANRKAIMDHPNDDIAVLPDGPVILTDGENPIIELVSASQEELQERYRRQLVKAKNDVVELRRIAKQDAERKQQSFETTRQQRLEQEIAVQYARDTQAGYITALPQIYDAVAIRKFDAQKMREVMSRFGASRITARLYGLTAVPDGHGGTIRFE